MKQFIFNYFLIGLGVYFGVGAYKLGELVRYWDKEEWQSLIRGFLMAIFIWPIMLAIVGALSVEKENKNES